MADPQITREDIELLRSWLASEGLLSSFDIARVLDIAEHARDEPARIEAARREGAIEMREDAIRAARSAVLPAGYRWGKDAMENFAVGKRCAADEIACLPLPDAPAPASSDEAPAEPSAPVAPEPVIKAIERALDECSAWIARPSPDVTRQVAIAAGIAWQANMNHEANRVPDLEDRIAALEAEERALREGLRPFSDAVDDLDEGDADAAHIWEAPVAMGLTVGDLRRARALLQGQGGDE